jgi:hypothetical protein
LKVPDKKTYGWFQGPFAPGTDIMILKILSQKMGEKIGVFLLKTKLNYAKI